MLFRLGCFRLIVSLTLASLASAPLLAQEAARSKEESKSGESMPAGVKVFSIGHSFHVFMPGILSDMARSAGIKDHVHLGTSGIGGSRVIQHWDVADDKFKVKANLTAAKVDVLTISPIFLPDAGIENFAKLAVENNPKIRITLQENWLPFDAYTPPQHRRPPGGVDHNAIKIDDLRKLQNQYLADLSAHIDELNKKLDTKALVIAPVGQAVLALREKIVKGEAGVLKMQSDLFTDDIGHATPPLQALVGYVHFSTTYGKSPVGLPTPAVLNKIKDQEGTPELVKLLQETAWEAVTSTAASGVTK